MRKVLCSFVSGPHRALLDLTRPTFETYASMHGYDLVLRTDDSGHVESDVPRAAWHLRARRRMLRWAVRRMPPSRAWPSLLPPNSRRGRTMDAVADVGLRGIAKTFSIPTPPSWKKLALIKELLATYDLVLWIDADAVVIDPTVDISRELTPGKWIYAVEHHTAQGSHVNAGVLMVRSCSESAAFLRDLTRQVQFKAHDWWDQAAILYNMGWDLRPLRRRRTTRYSNGLSVLDKRWNSIPPDRAEAPYIMHFAGMDHERRLQLMGERVKRFCAEYRLGQH